MTPINGDLKSLLTLIQSAAPTLLNSCCIINGEFLPLEDVQNMGYDEFVSHAKGIMPRKLYKYFSNLPTTLTDPVSGEPILDEKTGKPKTINYSKEALKKNTVFLQSPSLFDDVYDSDISLDFETYEKIRLLEYCKRCQLSVNASMSTQELGDALVQAVSQRFDPAIGQASLFTKRPDTLIEEKSNELFVLQLQIELSNHHDLGKAVGGAIVSSFKDYSRSLQNTFRASCFATTPFSQLMWGGSYANEHKGFCVEYTVLPNDPSYTTVYYNLFPMIYCKTRPNMTERLAKVEDNDLTKEWLWDIYFHGALRKSIDWAFQNEWRLLLPMGSNLKDSGYNIPFFPITKVFLGNRMPPKERQEIIDICKVRKIPYVGVRRNPVIFEMEECPDKCEDCPNYNTEFHN